ncbi:hypothetical protein D9611_011999 [Ephemerocybe angulata]|uniref:Uncharacterized protein n=1 Tax=Ephemerocybe angulata TaxID=980116 RepID=A0A8H5C447_9AGAR|nr:hypothetical protein D9611_011999 [Tulosesus angulatus]
MSTTNRNPYLLSDPRPQGYQRFSSSPGPGGPVPAQPHLQHHLQQQRQPIHPSSVSSGPMHGQQQQEHVPYVPGMACRSWVFQSTSGTWGVNDTTAQLGQSAIVAGQDYVQRNFGTIFPRPMIKSVQCASLELAARKVSWNTFCSPICTPGSTSQPAFATLARKRLAPPLVRFFDFLIVKPRLYTLTIQVLVELLPPSVVFLKEFS